MTDGDWNDLESEDKIEGKMFRDEACSEPIKNSLAIDKKHTFRLSRKLEAKTEMAVQV